MKENHFNSHWVRRLYRFSIHSVSPHVSTEWFHDSRRYVGWALRVQLLIRQVWLTPCGIHLSEIKPCPLLDCIYNYIPYLTMQIPSAITCLLCKPNECLSQSVPYYS